MTELNDVGVEDTTRAVFHRRKVAVAERIADLSEKKMAQDKKRDTIAIMMADIKHLGSEDQLLWER